MDKKEQISFEREDFGDGALEKEGLLANPFAQFCLWLDEACASEQEEPYACVLSTVSQAGYPNSRVVYVREFDGEGLVFFTNYSSLKGREIAQNDRACIHFFWSKFFRQVKVQGRIKRLDESRSEAYFKARPRESQLGAWASLQSEYLENRAELLSRLEMYREKFSGQEIPRPEHWGGYVLEAEHWEFWKGRASRLHDRFVYEKSDADSWRIGRLYP